MAWQRLVSFRCAPGSPWRGPPRASAACQAAEKKNAAQRVVDFVRHAGSQLTDHGQAVRPHQLLVRLAAQALVTLVYG